MSTPLFLRTRLNVEALEAREMLDAKLAVLPVQSTPTAQVSTVTAQPFSVDYGYALKTTYEAPVTYSTVTIRNQTSSSINYYLQWPGEGWKLFSVAANSSRIHWCPGHNLSPKISYDAVLGSVYREQVYSLTSRDYVGSAHVLPSYESDGKQYNFTRSNDGTTLNFFIVAGQDEGHVPPPATLNRSAYPSERAKISSADFPVLATNYEVLGPSTRTYNCIAHSLGYNDRWINPITSAGSNKLAGMDDLYKQQGYTRLSQLDYSLQAGYQKVVVYAQKENGVITKVTHAAIQSADGSWTSKLGQLALIKHLSPIDIVGPAYGVPVAVYMRPIPKQVAYSFM